jgi:hypothetical protein
MRNNLLIGGAIEEEKAAAQLDFGFVQIYLPTPLL